MDTEEDLFQSNDNFDEADTTETVEPTEEIIVAEQFESGLAQTLNIEQAEPDQSAVALIAGMTEDELKQAIAKANRFDEFEGRLTKTHDKAFGKIGQLEQSINDLKQASQGTQFTKETFASLTNYFGDDDLAEALANDLKGVQFGGGSGQSSIDEKIDTLTKNFEKKLLTVLHPDWEEIAVSGEFADWQKTLSDDARTTLAESVDGVQLGKAFTSFKDWKGKKAEAFEKKQNRLNDAITVTSNGVTIRTQSDPSAEAAFAEGLKAARNNR